MFQQQSRLDGFTALPMSVHQLHSFGICCDVCVATIHFFTWNFLHVILLAGICDQLRLTKLKCLVAVACVVVGGFS